MAWATMIKYHKWGDLTEIYFSQFWRLVSPRSRCLQGRFHSETSSLGCRRLPFFTVCSHDLFVRACGKRGRDLSLAASSYKATNAIGLGSMT